jgi:hypothetical protein
MPTGKRRAKPRQRKKSLATPSGTSDGPAHSAQTQLDERQAGADDMLHITSAMGGIGFRVALADGTFENKIVGSVKSISAAMEGSFMSDKPKWVKWNIIQNILDHLDIDICSILYKRVEQAFEKSSRHSALAIFELNDLYCDSIEFQDPQRKIIVRNTIKNRILPILRGVDPSIPSACDLCMQMSNALLVCSRCKHVRYCCKTCQTSDWKQHKLICVLRNCAIAN